MKKYSVVLAVAVLLFVMSGIVFGEKVKLIIDTQDFAPFSYIEKEKTAGPGVEIIDLVCKEINVDYEIRMLPWTRAQYEVKGGDAEGLFFLGKNKEREGWLEFGPPIINTEYGFFVNKDDKTAHKEVKDFANYTIGVYGPSNTATSLMDAIIGTSNVRIDMTPDDIAAFKKLNAKRVGAVYSNSDVGKTMIKDLKLENVRYAWTHKKLQYYIAFSKTSKNKDIIKKFYEVLEELQKKGEIKKILDKYNME